MKKILVLIAVLIVLIILLISSLTLFGMDLSKALPENPAPAVVSPKNASFQIDDQAIALKDGHFEAPIAPGSAQTMSVDYFGNEASGDVNGDGIADTAFLVTANSGGTGTFFYVLALASDPKSPSGFTSSEAYFIGDRIAPQTTNIDENGVIIVNYADRASGEPFTASPSVGKSLRLKLDPSMRFGIVENDFSGEANPSSMSLGMKPWNWVKTIYNDGTEIVDKNPSRFKLDFKQGGTFSASTDCNGVGGNYSVSGSSIEFRDMLGTLMFCEGSQEQEFTKALSQASSFYFTGKGELVIDLKMDSGSMIFK